MPPWKEWFQFVSKHDSNFLPVTNQKIQECHTLKESWKASIDAVCISPVLEMVTLYTLITSNTSRGMDSSLKIM
jgi:hypothetical protein